jgi:hypothetical protein
MVQNKEAILEQIVDLIHGEQCWSVELSKPISDTELWAVENELGTRLPWSYLTFLRHFGWARVGAYEIFGLPRNRLWGDIVLMNDLYAPALPAAHVVFSEDRLGRKYCFDTSNFDMESECPVYVLGSAHENLIAHSFLQFLENAALGEFPEEVGHVSGALCKQS